MALLKITPGESGPPGDDDTSNNRHRQLIGYIALLLPLFLILLVLVRDGPKKWKDLDSVSAYYYTGANAAFVGMLVVLALFLVAYEGYRNESQWADRWCARVAAAAALGVAFFPTSAPEGFPVLPWVYWWVVLVHFASAIVLLGTFAVFSLWLFRKKAKGKDQDPDKETRNTIYLICGVMIVVSIIWAGVMAYYEKSIFWPESVALIFFAISWLVKGYALRSIADVARSWITPKA